MVIRLPRGQRNEGGWCFERRTLYAISSAHSHWEALNNVAVDQRYAMQWMQKNASVIVYTTGRLSSYVLVHRLQHSVEILLGLLSGANPLVRDMWSPRLKSTELICNWFPGAGAVIQHIVADGGNTQPPLFANAITSSTFLPSQYQYNDRVPQVRASLSHPGFTLRTVAVLL